jgi:hypothetical protein
MIEGIFFKKSSFLSIESDRTIPSSLGARTLFQIPRCPDVGRTPIGPPFLPAVLDGQLVERGMFVSRLCVERELS